MPFQMPPCFVPYIVFLAGLQPLAVGLFGLQSFGIKSRLVHNKPCSRIPDRGEDTNETKDSITDAALGDGSYLHTDTG